MKKSLINYLMISLALFVATVLIVNFTSSDEEVKQEETVLKESVATTTLPISTAPIATYVEDATSQQIPNPCEVVSIENVKKYVPNVVVRGPLFQNAIASIKGCVWISGNDKNNKLGITIVLSPTAYDSVEATKTKDAVLGEKAFFVNGFTNSFQGASCGQSVLVKQRGYSFAIAYCNEDKEASIEKIIIELANGVANSLP